MRFHTEKRDHFSSEPFRLYTIGVSSIVKAFISRNRSEWMHPY